MRAQKIIKEAQVLFFAPPMISGYSASSDIELNMQDKTGGDLNHFFDVVKSIQCRIGSTPGNQLGKDDLQSELPTIYAGH